MDYWEINDWEQRAKCKKEGKPTKFFFPNQKNFKKVKEVKKYCRDCPVRVECLFLGEDTKSEGMYGGVTEKERKLLKILIARPTHQTFPDLNATEGFSKSA